jgi:hypothetical protein
VKRLVVLVVLLVIVVDAISSSSNHQTQTTTTESPPPVPSTPSNTASQLRAPQATANVRCDQNIRVNSHTTCGFADNVFRAYAQALHAGTGSDLRYQVEATSPATGKSYTMSCQVHGGTGSTATCIGATDAIVRFPVVAAREYSNPASKPERSSSHEDQTPSGESSGSEEDQVGSSSHATDAKFCSEHECIGSFTTEGGTIAECSDGTYSHAGGISGACSHHGGEH